SRGGRAHPQRAASCRRLADPFRRQRGGAAQQSAGADRDPYFRPRDPRAANRTFHEDHLSCARGALKEPAVKRIRKGDEVIVIAGKDKGRRGTVLRVYGDDRVLVENVNV